MPAESFRTDASSTESESFRRAAPQERVAAARTVRKPLFVLVSSLLCGASYLAIPMNQGCPGGELGVNYYWYLFANFLNSSMFWVPMFSLLHGGLCPGAAWPSFYVVWVCGVAYMVANEFVGWPQWFFYLFDGGSALPMWLSYGVCLRYGAGAGSTRPPADDRRGRWEAVEMHVLVVTFDEGPHQSWMTTHPDVPPGVTPQPRAVAFESPPRLVRRPVKQWLGVGFFVLCYQSFFAFLLVVMGILTKTRITMGVFAVFTVFALSAKLILKGVGFWLDTGKSGAPFSGYFCGHVLGTFFYYFYYRSLFENVDSWVLFVKLHSIHLAMEWVEHVARATQKYYSRVRATSDRLPPCLRNMVLSMFLSRQPNVSSDDWACFMANDFALQTYAIVLSITSYAMGYTMVYCIGYNHVTYAPFLDQMGEQYPKLMLQLGLQLVTEVANVCVMEWWFRRYLRDAGGAVGRINLLLESSRRFPLWFILISAANTTMCWPQFVAHGGCNWPGRGAS